MKKKILLLITLFSVLSNVLSQGYFSSQYYNPGSDSLVEGYIKVEYHNHPNPVKYSIVLGTETNYQGEFFDVSADSVCYGDSVGNILISFSGYMNQIPGAFEAYKAYAIDSVTLDTLGVVQSTQLQSYTYGAAINEIDFFNINSSVNPSLCVGGFEIDTFSNHYSGWSNSYISNQLKYSNTFTSNRDSMTTVLSVNNQNNTAELPDFGSYNLCPGYYEFACSKGFVVSFNIGGTSSNSFTANDVVVTETPYIECYNSAVVTVNHNSGPYTYSWDGGAFEPSSVKEELCSRDHNLRVANSIGDTVELTPFIHTLSFISTISTLNSCLGKSRIRIDTSYLDVSNFQYSWSGGDFTSENNVDSLCSGNHSLLIIDNFGDTLIQYFSIDLLDFYLGAYSDSNSCNGSAYIVPEGDPFAYFSFTGGDSLYISWNQQPFELYDMDNQSIDSLCEGIYSVSITGDVTGNDTLVFPFAIAINNNTFQNGGWSSPNDSVNYFIENCSIDYSTPIDSSIISSFTIIDSTRAVYVVDVWQSNFLTQLTDTVICYVDSTSLLKVSLTFYCSLKSNSDVFKVVNVVTPIIGETVSSIFEQKDFNISVFPNPSRGQITIKSNSDEPFQVYLYNGNGQLVLKGEEKNFELGNLAKGMYIMHYISKNRNEIHKIIKE